MVNSLDDKRVLAGRSAFNDDGGQGFPRDLAVELLQDFVTLHADGDFVVGREFAGCAEAGNVVVDGFGHAVNILDVAFAERGRDMLGRAVASSDCQVKRQSERNSSNVS